MAKRYEQQIGELCRNGRAVYYAFIDGEQVETNDRDELVRKLVRRDAERRFGH